MCFLKGMVTRLHSIYTLQNLHLHNTAVAIGYFDGLHVGHRAVIQQVVMHKQNHLIPTVFSFTDDRSHGAKNAEGCLLTLRQKEHMLEKMHVEEYICPPFSMFQNFTPTEFVSQILVEKMHAKLVCVGSDFRFGKHACADAVVLQTLCQNHNIQVCLIDKISHNGEIVSSSKIRTLIRQGDIKLANQMLGYRFHICGMVEKGNQIGRTIDFPTINQRIPQDMVLPRFGVYASITKIDGQEYVSVSNIGIKPTVGSDYPLLETYIENYTGDLYGRNLKVELIGFIRPERKFSSVEILKEEIKKNVLQAKEMFNKI